MALASEFEMCESIPSFVREHGAIVRLAVDTNEGARAYRIATGLALDIVGEVEAIALPGARRGHGGIAPGNFGKVGAALDFV